MIQVPAFSCCTACSEAVVKEYRERGVGFVQQVCNDLSGSVLEDLSGITALTQALHLTNTDWDDDDDDEDIDNNEEEK